MKKRIDVLLFERGLAPSREMARRYVMAGEVRANGQMVDKPGSQIDESAELTVKAAPQYASRGGEKLAGAFADFSLDVTGKICADVGASTGGFTDCLLQNGASKVYAIDVGYGQIALKLRNDPRVILMERTNARHVESLPEVIHFVSIDASFISLRLLLPVVKRWLATDGEVVALVKPQFEAGKQDVGKKGVVKDPEVHRKVLIEVLNAALEIGFSVRGLTRSPLTGPKGNVEFLAWLSLDSQSEAVEIEAAIAAAINV
jgi:23S rRNA (cytidine1920-2'-O)/16S rRNA (cytidine1409-2'-O)-methyltransferase